MESRKGLVTLLAVICVIGAINWGLVGFFNWNLINAVFGGSTDQVASTASRVIYALVGLAGLGFAYYLPHLQAPTRPIVEERGRQEGPRSEPPRAQP
jgi:uncharacterized membrane protein YuzA (DUF378 family)